MQQVGTPAEIYNSPSNLFVADFMGSPAMNLLEGTVKGVRQASARFAVPMVAFGDPREVDPFDIDCAVKGRGTFVIGR